MRWDDDDEIRKDRLFRDYDTVLKESAVLTTFGGVLFGFLLNISIRGANQLPYPERIILVLALFSVTIAVLLFVMPVIYHHVQFPYTDIDKFKKRAHRFILFGLVPTIVTLYLGMILAFSPLIDTLAYFVAGLPFLFVYILYRMRK
ncbi:MAG TPA: DUF6328 family protein [Candidatus Bathyarchaeia archaeon]|nr:DUF6328 family protein [Candidatus Bathyarchaeia archaeon]